MKTIDLSEWIQRFFQEYLSRQRNVSPATIAAYRDTFRLLLQYFGQKRRRVWAAARTCSYGDGLKMLSDFQLETKKATGSARSPASE